MWEGRSLAGMGQTRTQEAACIYLYIHTYTVYIYTRHRGHLTRVTMRLYHCYVKPGHFPPLPSSSITTPILVSLTQIINTGSLLLLIQVRCIHSCRAQTVASCLESRTQKRTLDHPHLALLIHLRCVENREIKREHEHQMLLL